MKNELLSPVNSSNDNKLLLDARYGNLITLKRFCNEIGAIELKKISETYANNFGKTALHEAAQNKHAAIVEYLLEDVNVDPDCLKLGDWTPLMLACTKSNGRIVKILIDHGADTNRRNKDGWTPFHIACRDSCVDTVSVLLENDTHCWKTYSNNGRTPLHTAGTTPTPQTFSSSQMEGTIFIALYGRLEIGTLLIKLCSFIPNEKDSCGSTPFMDSVRSGSIEFAKMLLHQHQADPYALDNLGRQSIHLAAESSSLVALKFLVTECNIDINTTTKSGQTPAHLAAKNGNLKILKILNTFGADFSYVDYERKRSPLHLASAGQHVECVEFLLSHGKVKDLPDSLGKGTIKNLVLNIAHLKLQIFN